MSSKTTIIFDESFDAYADALYKYLDSKGIELKWLAEKTTPKGQKVKSTQEKFSTWKKEGTKPNKNIRRKIDDILGVSIDFNADGKWVVSRAEVNDENNSESSSRKEFNGVSDSEVQYAGRVELPEDGVLSRDQLKYFLGQIESIARILKDSL